MADGDELTLIGAGTADCAATIEKTIREVEDGDVLDFRRGAVVVAGVFDTDRARAVTSLHRLAGLEVDTALFGHGDPSVQGVAAALREAVAAST